MKIKKETIVKLVIAAIVPGGFIFWGLHELGSRYRKNSQKNVSNDAPPESNK
jgi:hypothetical protein